MIFVETYRFESNCRDSLKVVSGSFKSVQDIGFREKIQSSMFSHPKVQFGNEYFFKTIMYDWLIEILFYLHSNSLLAVNNEHVNPFMADVTLVLYDVIFL